MKNVLIIGAHYDDAELGCGGTAAKLISQGSTVYKLTLTNSVTKSKHLNIHVEYEASIVASEKACKVLGGVIEVPFEPIDFNQLIYDTSVMQRIENVIVQYNIDTVFMHYRDDLNQDHIAANKLSTTAARHCKTVLAYQSNIYVLPTAYYPTLFVDITDYIDIKKKALSQYEGDHDRYNKLFATNIMRNQVWGYPNECEYAEAFHVIKMLI